MLNTIIMYPNVSCATGSEYLACMRKKSEIIGDFSEISSYTESTVYCDPAVLPFFIFVYALEMSLIHGFAL